MLTTAFRNEYPFKTGVAIDNFSASEGEDLITTVSLNAPLETDLTLVLGYIEDTALEGVHFDFDSLSYSNDNGITWNPAFQGAVSIPLGSSSTMIKILTTSNAVYDFNKQFRLRILSSSSEAITNFSAVQGTATIIELTPVPSMVFSTTGSPIAEGDDISATVTLNHPAAIDLSARLIISSIVPGTLISDFFNLVATEYSLDGGTTWLPAVDMDVLFSSGTTNLIVRLHTLVTGYYFEPMTFTLGLESSSGFIVSQFTPVQFQVTSTASTPTLSLRTMTIPESDQTTGGVVDPLSDPLDTITPESVVSGIATNYDIVYDSSFEYTPGESFTETPQPEIQNAPLFTGFADPILETPVESFGTRDTSNPVCFELSVDTTSASGDTVMVLALGDGTAIGGVDYVSDSVEYSTDGGITWKKSVDLEVIIPKGSVSVLVRVITLPVSGPASATTRDFTLSVVQVSDGVISNTLPLLISADIVPVESDVVLSPASAKIGSPLVFALTSVGITRSTTKTRLTAYKDLGLQLAVVNGTAIDGVDFNSSSMEVWNGTAWVAAPDLKVTIKSGTSTTLVRIPSVNTSALVSKRFQLVVDSDSYTLPSMPDVNDYSRRTVTGLISVDPTVLVVSNDIVYAGQSAIVDVTLNTTLSTDVVFKIESLDSSIAYSYVAAVKPTDYNESTLYSNDGGTTWLAYSNVTGATIPAGSRQARFAFVTNDVHATSHKSFTVRISEVTSSNVATFDSVGQVLIYKRPVVLISDYRVREGYDSFFVVQPQSVHETLNLEMATHDIQAHDGVDYKSDQMFYSPLLRYSYNDPSGVQWKWECRDWYKATGSVIKVIEGSPYSKVRIPTIKEIPFEADRAFKLAVNAVLDGLVESTSDTGTCTITDTAPAIFINNALTKDGSPLVFTASLSILSSEEIAFKVKTKNGTARDTVEFDSTGIEYSIEGPWLSAVDNVVRIPAGKTQCQIRIKTIAMVNTYYGNRTMILSVSEIVSGSVSAFNDIGTGTITTSPNLYVNNASAQEGNPLYFTVHTGVTASNQNLTFRPRFEDDSAVIEVNYKTGPVQYSINDGATWVTCNASGDIQLAAGTNRTIVRVPTAIVAQYSLDKYMRVGIASVVSGSVYDHSSVGVGRITSRLPVVTIEDSRVTRGDDLVFAVKTNFRNQTLSLQLGFIDGTGVQDEDYESATVTYSTDGGSSWTGTPTLVVPLDLLTLVKVKSIDYSVYRGNKRFKLAVTSVLQGAVDSFSDTGQGTIIDPTTIPLSDAVLLLHAESQPFVDECGHIVRTGDSRWYYNYPTSLSALDQSKFGDYSASFNGLSKLQCSGSDLILEGDFTISAWINFSQISAINSPFTPSNQYVFDFGVGQFSLRWLRGAWQLIVPGRGVIIDSTVNRPTPVDSLTHHWNHVAVTRSRTTVRLFVQGIQVGDSAEYEGPFGSSTIAVGHYGGDPYGSWALDGSSYPYLKSVQGYGVTGLIDEFIIVKGRALFTDSFIPPQAPYRIENTVYPTIAINDVTQPEGTPMVFDVSSDLSIDTETVIEMEIVAGTAIPTRDYTETLEVSTDGGTTWTTTNTATVAPCAAGIIAKIRVTTNVSVDYFGDKAFTLRVKEIKAGFVKSYSDTGTGTIIETTTVPAATLLVSDGSIVEGGKVSLDITADYAQAVTILGKLGLTAGTATLGTDYTLTGSEYSVDNGASWISSGSDGSFALLPGTKITKVRIPTLVVNTFTGDKTFTVGVASISQGTVLAHSDTGTATIQQPTAPVLTLVSNQANDTASMIFEARSNAPSSKQDVVFRLALANGTAIAGTDYTATPVQYSNNGGVTWTTTNANRDITLTRNTSAVKVKVSLIDNPIYSASNRTFTASISSVLSGTVSSFAGSATLTIIETTPAAQTVVAQIVDATAVEGSDLVFPITLSKSVSSATTVVLQALEGTALNTVDYLYSNLSYSTDNNATWTVATNVDASGVPSKQIVIPAGKSVVSIKVPTVGNITYDDQRQFTLKLVSVSGAIFSNLSSLIATGNLGLISDDESAPTLSINDPEAAKGSPITFAIATDVVSSRQDITFKIALEDDTALAGVDYSANDMQYSVDNGTNWSAYNNTSGISLARNTSAVLVKVNTL